MSGRARSGSPDSGDHDAPRITPSAGEPGEPPSRPRTHARGQLSLPAVEAIAGVLLIFGVLSAFALGTPTADTREPQLDAYAQDAAAVLAGEAPRHQGASRLAEVVRSPSAFQRERSALRRRVDRILPDNLLFRVDTPHGTVGYRLPADAPVGSATVTTTNGDVTIWVWYA